MTLDNPANWSRVFQGTFQMAQLGPFRGQIEPIWSPLLTQHTIRVQVISTEGKVTWNYAGRLTQVLGVEKMEFAREKLFLNRYCLFIFPQHTLDYKIKLEPAPWHKQLQVSLDVYNE